MPENKNKNKNNEKNMKEITEIIEITKTITNYISKSKGQSLN